MSKGGRHMKLSLKAARVNAGYTQKQVANIIGINYQTLGKYEKDSSNISLKILNELITLYNVDVNNIFLGVTSSKLVKSKEMK